VPTNSSSSSSSSIDGDNDEVWVRFYASDHAEHCLDILAAWIPDTFADSFRKLHEVSANTRASD
jgi:hypothetical protein